MTWPSKIKSMLEEVLKQALIIISMRLLQRAIFTLKRALLSINYWLLAGQLLLMMAVCFMGI